MSRLHQKNCRNCHHLEQDGCCYENRPCFTKDFIHFAPLDEPLPIPVVLENVPARTYDYLDCKDCSMYTGPVAWGEQYCQSSSRCWLRDAYNKDQIKKVNSAEQATTTTTTTTSTGVPSDEWLYISDEVTRTYHYSDGFKYEIYHPLKLKIGPNGQHRVIDQDNISHYILPKFVAISWTGGTYTF